MGAGSLYVGSVGFGLVWRGSVGDGLANGGSDCGCAAMLRVVRLYGGMLHLYRGSGVSIPS